MGLEVGFVNQDLVAALLAEAPEAVADIALEPIAGAFLAVDAGHLDALLLLVRRLDVGLSVLGGWTTTARRDCDYRYPDGGTVFDTAKGAAG